MGLFQCSASFDLNLDPFDYNSNGVPGWPNQPGNYLQVDDSQLIGQHYNVAVNGPIAVPAPWWFESWAIPTGNTGGGYSAGSVWSGVQFFTTPDARFARKFDRVFSNGAVTFTPWLKIEDFNCPGETY